MARHSADSLLNSLKGKIWLATSALAFLICTFGVLSYLVISFVVSDTFYAVFIPFLILSFFVMVFGWWLSNEVVRPIEKVSLLAKSLERSANVSLPKTSGSTETDELLQTLHRNSQQLQNIVSLMDNVAGGNLNVALTPLQNSDRLSNSFQKLLAKVSESINAKQKLEKLEAAVEQIVVETLPIRKGKLTVEIKSDHPETREISETLNFLVHNFNELLKHVKKDSLEAKNSAVLAQKAIQTVIREDENKAQTMNEAVLMLRQMPTNVQKVSDELCNSMASANQSIERARKGTQTAQENLAAVGNLRKQIQESVKRIQRLSERSQEITKISKSVDDLAHRTNLIALNASIQAVENNEKGHGFTVLAEEVERLSVRAENTNKEISTLNKSIAAEISEVESSLQSTVQEAASLSKFAIETGNALSELERYVGQFLNLQSKLAAYSSMQSADADKTCQAFIESVCVNEKSVVNLKETSANIVGFSALMENFQIATADFETAEIVAIEETQIGAVTESNFHEEIYHEEIAQAEAFTDFSQTFEPNTPAQ